MLRNEKVQDMYQSNVICLLYILFTLFAVLARRRDEKKKTHTHTVVFLRNWMLSLWLKWFTDYITMPHTNCVWVVMYESAPIFVSVSQKLNYLISLVLEQRNKAIFVWIVSFGCSLAINFYFDILFSAYYFVHLQSVRRNSSRWTVAWDTRTKGKKSTSNDLPHSLIHMIVNMSFSIFFWSFLWISTNSTWKVTNMIRLWRINDFNIIYDVQMQEKWN